MNQQAPLAGSQSPFSNPSSNSATHIPVRWMNWAFEMIWTLNGQFTSSPFAVAEIWGQGSAKVERPEYYAHHGPHSTFFVVLCSRLKAYQVPHANTTLLRKHNPRPSRLVNRWRRRLVPVLFSLSVMEMSEHLYLSLNRFAWSGS